MTEDLIYWIHAHQLIGDSCLRRWVVEKSEVLSLLKREEDYNESAMFALCAEQGVGNTYARYLPTLQQFMYIAL